MRKLRWLNPWLVLLILIVACVPAGLAYACPLQVEADGRAECARGPKRVRPVRTEPPHTELDEKESTVPFAVAQVITASVAVYAHPADYYESFPPVRDLGKGYVWVSIVDSSDYNGETWYRINQEPDEYVRADNLALMKPSRFHGVTLPEQPGAAFAFVLTPVKPVLNPAGPANSAAEPLNRYDVVTIYEEDSGTDGLTWYRVGTHAWVPQTALGVVSVDPIPEGVGPDDKWIEVDLFEQTLAAYEGPRMVYATLVSSGLKQWATDPGLFRIWAKLQTTPMSGRDGKPDYYNLEDVPWTMYFNHDQALHGAYWHDRFGFQHSHGCVNLAPLDARWLFDWTTPAYPEGAKVVYPSEGNPGTWVWVH